MDFIVDQFLLRATDAVASRAGKTAEFAALRQTVAATGSRWMGIHFDQKWPAAAPYDHIVVCVGQHFAAETHWTFAAFQAVVKGFLGLAAQSKVVWLTTPAMPPRNDGWVKSKRDWRNSHRFAMMNAWALSLVRSHPSAKVVDYFGVTYPMLWTSKDLAHFMTFPQDAVVDLLLHTLC